jgi:hypothetical protein
MNTLIVLEEWTKEILSSIVLNCRRFLDIISCVHRRTVVFPSIFIVRAMIIDVCVDLMMNSGVPVNMNPRLVPIGMISFVLMVNVSKEVDAT